MGQIIYREYIVFQGSNISCSLATTFQIIRWVLQLHQVISEADCTATSNDRELKLEGKKSMLSKIGIFDLTAKLVFWDLQNV